MGNRIVWSRARRYEAVGRHHEAKETALARLGVGSLMETMLVSTARSWEIETHVEQRRWQRTSLREVDGLDGTTSLLLNQGEYKTIETTLCTFLSEGGWRRGAERGTERVQAVGSERDGGLWQDGTGAVAVARVVC